MHATFATSFNKILKEAGCESEALHSMSPINLRPLPSCLEECTLNNHLSAYQAKLLMTDDKAAAIEEFKSTIEVSIDPYIAYGSRNMFYLLTALPEFIAKRWLTWLLSLG